MARAAWPSGTIEDQFRQLNDMSRTSEGLKLIRRDHLQTLQSNIRDSINRLQAEIIAADSGHEALEEKLEQLGGTVEDLQAELQMAKAVQNEVSVLGIAIDKNIYHTILWVTIGVLLLLLIFNYQRTFANARTAREARENLATLQEEHDKHRKKALEREQKLKRQLQDEINNRPH